MARLIMEHIHWKKPFKRLWISSLTAKAIKEGFNNLKPGKEYDNLYRAAKSRSEADWLIGFNVSRSLTVKYNDQLSAGRVQTPTLSMMVKREHEINNFKPVPFWILEGKFPGFTAQYVDKNNNTRFFNKDSAEELKGRLMNKPAFIKTVTKKEKREEPPLLYDLTELQREANKRYGFTAQKTLKTIQSLYEFHKAVTYPRTDSRYITDDMVASMDMRLRALPPDYKNYRGEIIKNNFSINSHCVNNSKVTDHHALLPTEEHISSGVLSSDEGKIYNLIVKRFLENFYSPSVYEQVKVSIEIDGERFTASGKTLLHEGWKKIERNPEGGDKLPPLQEGQKFEKFTLEIKSSHTQPPSRYTEATLLTEMEKYNLGTPSTRADIIEKLININYVERKEKSLIPTHKGKQIVDIVVTDLRSPELTSKWEKELEEITRGKKQREDFMKDILLNTKRLVEETLSSDKNYKHDNLLNISCPECGKKLLSVKKKDTLMHVCSDRNCRYRKVVTKLTEQRCATCHKKMEIKETKGGMMFICRICNVHQKVSEFQDKGRVTSRDISRLNRENDEKFRKADNPFAVLKDLIK
ncbi:MAG: DNA topoisomerase 3 [bacterium ADurb.Bin363]|nr:MAG: DNA topoisomerase 3 [bacterium ADurb.Bin363]